MPFIAAIASLLVFCAVVVLILRAVRQAALVKTLTPGRIAAQADLSCLTVIVPARNEAGTIRACVDGIRQQTYPRDRLRAVIVDDESSDLTAEIARGVARHDKRLCVVRSPRLPEGWTGKSHACWFGTRNLADDPQWLCFIDADVVPHRDLLRAAVAAAEAEKLDLLSLAPRQILVSFAERLILPCGFYLLAFSKDLRRTDEPGTDEAQATGMFILVRRCLYEAAGGHRAVANAISEDTALARAVKKAGGKVAMWDGGRLLQTRMYAGWPSLKTGIGKNVVDMLGGGARTIATALFGAALAWAIVLAPLADLWALAGGGLLADTSLALALAAALMAFAFHISGALHFGIPFWYGVLFPLAYTAGARIALESVLLRMTGRVTWKGRSYPAPGPSASAPDG